MKRLWQTLPAVQNDQVYILSAEWRWYNPISRAWELANVTALLAK